MDLLLIGLSRFARRRILPAAAAVAGITAVSIASRHATDALHRDWRLALKTHPPGLAYVSLTNDEHADAVRHALDHGWHVVVDKPALPDLPTAERLVDLARRSSLLLAEATCYAFHPMFSVITRHAAEATKAVAVFTPPVPATDFRHDRAKGGGALLDTGPYLASLGRVLWGHEPEEVSVMVTDRTPDGLDLSYSALARYPGGRTAIGHFGFTSTYRNTLQLLGPDEAVDIERPFSLPPDTAPTLTVHRDGAQHAHRLPPADSMHRFLTRVMHAIHTGSRAFDAPLLSDARTLARLRHAAGDGR
ncbi:Gfo/Idh/MocA family protein [Kitasatospora brasiliensis]|uniref:Gfo/Idh/MocA family protein n=1 Tax=Kitasatospora brasiliensis TaxID=3058040 RepID=UPI00292D912F|nr:Gfo/Idh/MocA family oxidoreductase [Kitasatospora sp. K002]